MAWTYSDWRTYPVGSAQTARLAAYIKEVEDKIAADVAADGKSRSSHPLVSLASDLAKRYDQMVSAGGVAAGVSLAAFRKPR